jgi:hypothetical protein
MLKLNDAAEVLVLLTAQMHASAPRTATAGALDSIRDTLVAELGCSKADAVAAVRRALLRLADRSRSPLVRRAAAAVRASL